jgi:hypothetical protein
MLRTGREEFAAGEKARAKAQGFLKCDRLAPPPEILAFLSQNAFTDIRNWMGPAASIPSRIDFGRSSKVYYSLIQWDHSLKHSINVQFKGLFPCPMATQSQ